MNRENLESSWGGISDKLKSRFSKLTDNDLLFVKGKEEELLCRIQLRIQKSRETVLALISTL